MSRLLELAVRPRLELHIGDGKKYTVEYPVTAVVAAEKASGKSLKSLADWFDLTWNDVAPVLHSGLAKHHPEATLEEVTAFCEDLGAEGVLEVRHALICLNFPRTMERIETARRSNASPNVESGAVI